MKFDSHMTVNNNNFGTILVGIKVDKSHKNSVFKVLFDGFFTSLADAGNDVS